ncbi:MAG: hypothetical protein ACLGI9_12030 [Thermoanaerobaculia bacterium]
MRHIHPIQPIALIILIVVLIYYKRKTAAPADGAKPGGEAKPRSTVSQPVKPEESAETIFKNLRREALATTADKLVLGRTYAADEPYGLLMEMEISGSVVTLVCFATGDASVYYRTGGGMVGGSAHETVRKAAVELVLQTRAALPRMIQAGGHPLPGPGKVRFYALTPKGVYTTETDRESLADPESPLGPLFYSGQEVVTQMRLVQEKKSQRAVGT